MGEPKLLQVRYPKSVGIIIDTVLNIPPETGVTYRLYYLSKAIATLGITIKVFLCNRVFETDNDVEYLLSASPLQFHVIPEQLFYNPQRLAPIVKSDPVDILQTEDAITLLRCKSIGLDMKVPFCLELHDIESLLLQSLGRDKDEVTRFASATRNAALLSSQIICMTPTDHDQLVNTIGVDPGKIVIVPNPVDPKEFPYYGPRITPPNILFLGNMFYRPNQNAVEDIFNTIYPEVYKQREEIKFTFIGMVPDAIRKRFGRSNFIFLGNVANQLNEHLSQTTIALCPVSQGSGMKVKILNYCAAGLPIITTSIGASGYEKITSLIIEDNLNKYPALINSLLDDPDRMIAIGKSNRIQVIRHFGIDKIAKKMGEIYAGIINVGEGDDDSHQSPDLNIPPLLWLEEKRINIINNENCYVVRDGKISKTLCF